MAVTSDTRAREMSYPCLMEYSLCGERYIFLMTNEDNCTVVWSNNDDKYSVGTIILDFQSRAEYQRAVPYHAAVVLQNEY